MRVIKKDRADRSNPEPGKTYTGKIDYYGVYSPELDKYYLIPIQEHTNSMRLRIYPAKNSQVKSINIAEHFLFKE